MVPTQCHPTSSLTTSLLHPQPHSHPHSTPSPSLTAAKLITAIRTVRFLVTVEAGRDALVGGDTSELCGRTFFPRLLDGWGQNQVE